MLIAGILVIGVGLVVIGIGCAFIIPYKNVKRFASNKVQGEIVDMVWNATMYNEPLDKAANVEHVKVAGMEFQPGTRTKPLIDAKLNTDTVVWVGATEQDMHTPVVGRSTINTFHKVYRYVVNGKEYTRADGVRYNKGAVQPLIGKPVMVYFNPENPQQSTLSNGGGYKLTMIILYIIGGLLMLLGIMLLLLDNLFFMLY